MGSVSVLILLILSSLPSTTTSESNGQSIESARGLDFFIRDYTFKSLDKHYKTGLLQSVNLPSNLFGIKVDTIRFRCGSLRRYGARIKEFHLSIGVIIHPCIERVILIRQNLGYNWSSIYYNSNYHLSGYQLVSPIVGILAYNADTPFQVGIFSAEKPMTINFTNAIPKFRKLNGITPLCASFEGDGRMTLANSSSPHVCVAKRHGHFGLVVGSQPDRLEKKVSRWKVAFGSTIGATLGAFLLGLLIVAMFVRVKKRSRMEEMKWRAYQEEALQVSMVGHVRAPMAVGTRTTPILEHEYVPPPC